MTRTHRSGASEISGLNPELNPTRIAFAWKLCTYKGDSTLIEFSAEQQKNFDAILTDGSHVITLGGYAGTGKTTMTVALQEKTGYAVSPRRR
jgi:hypothetical protein